jgi:hypothetical protein
MQWLLLQHEGASKWHIKDMPKLALMACEIRDRWW